MTGTSCIPSIPNIPSIPGWGYGTYIPRKGSTAISKHLRVGEFKLGSYKILCVCDFQNQQKLRHSGTKAGFSFCTVHKVAMVTLLLQAFLEVKNK